MGFAVFYQTFSTVLGKRGLHLDDLYISPKWRGKGLGTALLRRLAAIAVQRGCGRFEWWCMKDNAPALEFYDRIGALRHDEVFILRLQGEAIAAFEAAIPAGAVAGDRYAAEQMAMLDSERPPAA